MDKRVDKIIDIPCNDKMFYRLWLSFLKPIHHFTPQVIDMAAEFLWHHEKLSKIIIDEKTLAKFLLSSDTKKEIIEACKITPATYSVTLNKLRKEGFFKDGVINPKLIPHLNPGQNDFNLMLMFKIQNEE